MDMSFKVRMNGLFKSFEMTTVLNRFDAKASFFAGAALRELSAILSFHNLQNNDVVNMTLPPFSCIVNSKFEIKKQVACS